MQYTLSASERDKTNGKTVIDVKEKSISKDLLKKKSSSRSKSIIKESEVKAEKSENNVKAKREDSSSQEKKQDSDAKSVQQPISVAFPIIQGIPYSQTFPGITPSFYPSFQPPVYPNIIPSGLQNRNMSLNQYMIPQYSQQLPQPEMYGRPREMPANLQNIGNTPPRYSEADYYSSIVHTHMSNPLPPGEQTPLKPQPKIQSKEIPPNNSHTPKSSIQPQPPEALSNFQTSVAQNISQSNMNPALPSQQPSQPILSPIQSAQHQSNPQQPSQQPQQQHQQQQYIDNNIQQQVYDSSNIFKDIYNSKGIHMYELDRYIHSPVQSKDTSYDSLLQKRKQKYQTNESKSPRDRFPRKISRYFDYFDLDEDKYDKDSKGDDIKWG